MMSLVTNDILYPDHHTKEFTKGLTGKFFTVQLSSPLKGFIAEHFYKSIQVSAIADLPQKMAYNGLARQFPLLNVGMKLSY